MIRGRVEFVKVVNAVRHGVEERVFLRIERPGLDRGNHLREIHDLRDGSEELERSRLDLAGQHSNRHPFEIRGNPHRPQAIRHVAEAVFEPAEDPKVHTRFDSFGQHPPEAPVDGAACR